MKALSTFSGVNLVSSEMTGLIWARRQYDPQITMAAQESQNPPLSLLFHVSPLQGDRQGDKGTPSWELEIWCLQIIQSPPLEQ